jgi:hypothetical protein
VLLAIGLKALILTHHVWVRQADVRVGNDGLSSALDLLALHPIPDFLALQLAHLEPEVHVLARLGLGQRLILKDISQCRPLR